MRHGYNPYIKRRAEFSTCSFYKRVACGKVVLGAKFDLFALECPHATFKTQNLIKILALRSGTTKVFPRFSGGFSDEDVEKFSFQNKEFGQISTCLPPLLLLLLISFIQSFIHSFYRLCVGIMSHRTEVIKNSDDTGGLIHEDNI